jgi:hypothetical protein
MKKETKMKLVELKDHINKPVDIFVGFSSFEKRCLIIPKTLKDCIDNAVIFSFEDATAPLLNNENKKSFREILGNKIEIKEFPRNKPIKIADNIIGSLNDKFKLLQETSRRLLIDISTFSREALLILFKWLLENRLAGKHDIQFVYNSAAGYSLNEEKAEDKWLTRGIGDIRSILGYAGSISPSKKLHLVIQVGFEVDRALKHIESYEPAITSLGLGGEDSSICSEHYSVNRKKHQMIKELNPNVEDFNFSCINPIQTKEDLRKQIDKHKGYNVVIAPLNTKLSAIGAALLAFEKPEIQICYATANTYNIKGYSVPGDECYLFGLDELIEKKS